MQEIMKTALTSYQLGEIDFFQFVNSYENATQIQLEFIINLLTHNLLAIKILYYPK